jgi:DNA-binding beta-propeller fold protein YncE
MSRPTLTLIVAAATLLLGAPPGSAAVGDLSYKGCISGESESGPDACKLIPGATSGGGLSGLNAIESVTVSPDGRQVYGIARVDASIAIFKRDRKKGALKYKGCLTGDTTVGACDQIPTATAGGQASGLDDVRALAIAKGGKSVYAVSANDDAVARFGRDGKGLLLFKDCLSGDTATGLSGTGACETISSASAGGGNSGLDHPKSLAISADGKSLYLAATEDAAIAQFKRTTGSGALEYEQCVTGETQSGSTGSGACAETDGDGSNGDNSGLDDPRGLALTKKGKQLVGVSSDDDALFAFDRDRDNGDLAFDGCFTGESETVANAGCDASFPTAGGADSGFDDTRSLALGKGGKDIYVVSRFDASVVHFRINGGIECLSADTGAGGGDPCDSIATPAVSGQDTGLQYLESAVLSADGRTLYVSAAADAGVTTFKRNLDTGVLTYKGCITGESGLPCDEIGDATTGGDNSGLSFPQFIALSPDDKSLYVTASNDDAVARFNRKR